MDYFCSRRCLCEKENDFKITSEKYSSMVIVLLHVAIFQEIPLQFSEEKSYVLYFPERNDHPNKVFYFIKKWTS